jgi:hypothetical protein
MRRTASGAWSSQYRAEIGTSEMWNQRIDNVRKGRMGDVDTLLELAHAAFAPGRGGNRRVRASRQRRRDAWPAVPRCATWISDAIAESGIRRCHRRDA